jgi:hypothetical protein
MLNIKPKPMLKVKVLVVMIAITALTTTRGKVSF